MVSFRIEMKSERIPIDLLFEHLVLLMQRYIETNGWETLIDVYPSISTETWVAAAVAASHPSLDKEWVHMHITRLIEAAAEKRARAAAAPPAGMPPVPVEEEEQTADTSPENLEWELNENSNGWDPWASSPPYDP